MTKMRIAIAHFKSAAARHKALEHLSEVDRRAAQTPLGLAALVKKGTVSDKLVWRLLLKVGGMSRALPPPGDAAPKKVARLLLGQPFLTSDDGPVLLQRIISAHPKGFRQPSHKAKKWNSTSLAERIAGVKLAPTRSDRGKERAIADAEHRQLAKATQDIRNIDDKYLSGTQRWRKSMMPPLPPEQAADAIQFRHAKARGEREAARAKAALAKLAA